MSQESVEVVKALYEHFNRAGKTGDFEPYVREFFDPDCEYEPIEEEEPVRGHHALIRWNERWFEAWDDFHADVDQLIVAGNSVVSALTVHGHGAGSGMDITGCFFHVFDLRQNKVLRMREYTDRHEALEAVGLSE